MIVKSSPKLRGVLILVLMEDTLRGNMYKFQTKRLGLNPCFNGRYSQRSYKSEERKGMQVLILVLMEDTLRVSQLCFTSYLIIMS